MAVRKKDKGASISAPSRTIVAEDVRIENGMFVDEDGNISERISECLVNPTDTFKITIRITIDGEDEN